MTLRGALVLLMLCSPLSPVAAADSSATERLMQVADCIRDAGDLKGAPREAFMSDCQARKTRAAGETSPPSTTAASVAPAMAVTPIGSPSGDGLPPQERILGCATASKGMQGDARAAYLKECLTGRIVVPAVSAEQNKRRVACATQAGTEPVDERQAFMLACMDGSTAAAAAPAPQLGAVASGVNNSARVPVLRDESEMRRRAACNVAARDMQGTARKTDIEQCINARAALTRAGSTPALAVTAPQFSTRERLVRSKACADQAHAKVLVGVEILSFMNACMAQH